MYRNANPPDKIARAVARLKQQYPTAVPLVVEPDLTVSQRTGLDLKEQKFAVPGDWTLGKFMTALRDRLHLKKSLAYFLFVSPRLSESILPPISSNMRDVYEQYHEPETGMLWLTLTAESTFGSLIKCLAT